MKVLGIDFGERRIGIAVSDGAGQFAHGLCTLWRKGIKRDMEFIKELVKKEGVERIVLGLPVGFDGKEGTQCAKIRNFGIKLGEEVGLPVFYTDEVLSTEEAKEILTFRPRRRRLKKEEIDRVSAAVILQRYLDKINREY